MNVNEINAASLAYAGDAAYELRIRHHLISKGINNVNELQNEAVRYVSATAQATLLDKLLGMNILTDEELYTVGRARNYHPRSKPKNTDIKTYKKATAFEALFGMHYLVGNDKRLDELMKVILGD
ncbi:MAG: ribonuclease III domain-containing protein [Bacilli bacterium]|nr:ribonuclease III domain-containing protein [Bacilli bacterium]